MVAYHEPLDDMSAQTVPSYPRDRSLTVGSAFDLVAESYIDQHAVRSRQVEWRGAPWAAFSP